MGSVIGGLLASPLNFHFGRKWPLIAAYIISVGGGLLQVFAPNLGAFVGGRSINSVALGIINATAPLYISEVTYTPSWWRYMTLTVETGCSRLNTRAMCQFNQYLELDSWRGGHCGSLPNK